MVFVASRVATTISLHYGAVDNNNSPKSQNYE